jgi:hypothetical protein
MACAARGCAIELPGAAPVQGKLREIPAKRRTKIGSRVPPGGCTGRTMVDHDRPAVGCRLAGVLFAARSNARDLLGDGLGRLARVQRAQPLIPPRAGNPQDLAAKTRGGSTGPANRARLGFDMIVQALRTACQWSCPALRRPLRRGCMAMANAGLGQPSATRNRRIALPPSADRMRRPVPAGSRWRAGSLVLPPLPFQALQAG